MFDSFSSFNLQSSQYVQSVIIDKQRLNRREDCFMMSDSESGEFYLSSRVEGKCTGRRRSGCATLCSDSDSSDGSVEVLFKETRVDIEVSHHITPSVVNYLLILFILKLTL